MTQVLGNYFDPASGSLPQRIERLVKRDGELETILSEHLDGDRSMLAQTLAQHVGSQSPLFKLLSPEQSDGLVATLARTIDRALGAQSEQVLREFSLNVEDSSLSRILDEIIHSGRLIKRRGEKVVSSGERLRETLEREVASLQDNVKALRKEGT